ESSWADRCSSASQIRQTIRSDLLYPYYLLFERNQYKRLIDPLKGNRLPMNFLLFSLACLYGQGDTVVCHFAEDSLDDASSTIHANFSPHVPGILPLEFQRLIYARSSHFQCVPVVGQVQGVEGLG